MGKTNKRNNKNRSHKNKSRKNRIKKGGFWPFDSKPKESISETGIINNSELEKKPTFYDMIFGKSKQNPPGQNTSEQNTSEQNTSEQNTSEQNPQGQNTSEQNPQGQKGGKKIKKSRKIKK